MSESDPGVDQGNVTEPLEIAVRMTEALVFASAEPTTERAIADLLQAQGGVPPEIDDLSTYVDSVMQQLCAAYSGRGVSPVRVAGGWQFRTAPDLASRLTRVIPRPRRLGRSAMETLAVVAYHQPCTRAEIETIRGVTLSQTVLDALLEESLIVPKGRKEVPGRPVLWGTSADFLRYFGLRDLRDLPRREELIIDVPETNQDKHASEQIETLEVVGAVEADSEQTDDVQLDDAPPDSEPEENDSEGSRD